MPLGRIWLQYKNKTKEVYIMSDKIIQLNE